MNDDTQQLSFLPTDLDSMSASDLRALVRALLITIQTLHDQIALLTDQNVVLQSRIADLESRLNQHSGNSSKPPSSDPPSAPPRPPRTPRGTPQKQGAQPGHPGHQRELVSSDKVDTVVEHYPS